MPCHHPIRAWRTRGGAVLLNREAPDAERLHLPCGGCLGCRTSAAKAWALRCHLELQQHDSAVFSTLTYDRDKLPPTLQKRDLQLWIKRVRKALGPARPIRFFASGEYGEQRGRPHYHALVFGASTADEKTLDQAWQRGFTRTEPVTPARIAYCAGYTSKKLTDARHTKHERVDPATGEVYHWQPPFIQMSRRPGIGGEARQHTTSWRLLAIHNGQRMPVPRFYHEAWKRTATAQMLEALEYEKQQHRQGKQPTTPERLAAEEQITIARQALKAAKRHYE